MLIAEKDLDSIFETKFSELFSSETQQDLFSKNIRKLALKGATKTIVDEIEKLLIQ
jgi:hypothetical protein